MVNYMTTASDVEMGLQQKTVVLVEKKSSTGWMGKIILAIFVVVLCCGGALLFVSYWNGRQEMQAVPEKSETLIEKKDTDPHYTLSRISSKAKAAIHLEGSFDEGENRKDQVEWKNGQGQAFAQGDFQLDNNTIIIPKTGLYFVYSQASFRVTCGEGDKHSPGKSHIPLSHRVWRYSDSIGTETTLLNAVRSACQNSALEGGYSEGQSCYNAIYLGAVFQLKMGDKLRTETNQLSELETEEGKTFFGVFAL
ncbi:tumor necrosis factor b (TNF superfamily, member 2) [Takifugu rubripes]|uniref:Lymphotoxin-alpha n=1 Tax=Takifugu rubripes TaxID=31033 RepID=Q4W8A0_TAKRU|nr:tumor necrosis factor b (TNF superfamily, member 2) [Takifugu rubripes]BAD98728.1 tumor necrosis factor alpha [Takifugu rubripes]|eukprot:NP_001033074.1 tumor necrosis factor alpha [Takifugu rubripes]